MTQLKIGDIAPDFKAKDQDGNEINLSMYKGKKVLLYFYPKDNTPGCTAEACNLRDNYSDMVNKGYEIIGVSADNERSHINFKGKFQLPFPLIADVDKKVIMAYGAWGKKQMYGKSYEGILRLSFVISENGKIEKIIEKVKTNDHARQIFEK